MGFQEELSESNEKLERDYEAALVWDDDERKRFFFVAESKVTELEREVYGTIEEYEGRMEELSRSLSALVDEWEAIFDRVEDDRFLTVYRLLALDEDPSKGLHRDDADFTISATEHLEVGSFLTRRSQYISTSKDYGVCLFYANKAVNERGYDPSDLKIVQIKLDLKLGRIYDLENRDCRESLGIEDGSTAFNFARKFREVLVARSITAEEIIHTVDVPSVLPTGRSYDEFLENRLRLTRSHLFFDMSMSGRDQWL